MEQYYEILNTGITALITAVITWFFTRRKQNAEIESNEIDNVEKAIKIWRDMSEGLKHQIDNLKKEISNLETLVNDLKKENSNLREELEALKDERN